MLLDIGDARRMPTAYDLSEAALDHARDLIGGNPETLLVPTGSVVAGRLAERKGLRVIVLPLMPRDSWAVIGGNDIVYSDGA